MNQSMTCGNPLRLILLFALPLLLGNVVQQFYNICDTAITGHLLGDGALAAIGATSTVYSLVISFSSGMDNGFALLVSNAFGSGDSRRMRQSTAVLVALNVVMALVLTALFLLLIRPLMVLLRVPQNVFSAAYGYIFLILAGLPATLCYNASAALLRAVGNSRTPLAFLALASLLNIALDFAFVAGLGLGVQGAALATVLAQLFSGVLCTAHIVRHYPIFHFKKEDFQGQGALVSEMLTTGLSMGLMLSIFQIGSVILQGAINGLGEAYIAAQVGGRKLLDLAMQPFLSLTQATSTYVSQNHGAGESKRIGNGVKVIILTAFVWSTIVLLLLWLPAPLWVRLLTGSTDPIVLNSGALYLRMGLPLFYPLAVLLVLRNALQALGHRIAPVAGSVIELAGKMVFAGWIVPAVGYAGVCLCEPVLWVICMLFMAAFSWHCREEFR